MSGKNNGDDGYAESYGRQWVDQSKYWASLKYHVRYQKQFIDRLALENPTKILECGSGTGEIAQFVMDRYLTEDGPEVDFFLADISATLLKTVRENLTPPKRVRPHLVQATAERLPFGDDYFDCIYALSMLWYSPDPKRSILDMLRILKPGGVLCFDIMSVLNTTGAFGNISNKVSVAFRGGQRVTYLLPSDINSMLLREDIVFDATGYMPILPTTLPGIGNCLNLYNAMDWLPKTTNAFLIQFCNKTIYCIKKNGLSEK
jgi:ubiquinone/menaquinone biosynthesis C-methylase UbiE